MINCLFENRDKASLRHAVVHAIVEKDKKLLLVKRSTKLSLEGGKWALPGGFLDRDETAEEGALRELKEETGWEGKIISLFKINTNPNRPHEDRQNVTFEFLIKATNLVVSPDNESSEVEWISFKKLPSFEEFAFDHGETIKTFIEYKEKKFPLPLFL